MGSAERHSSYVRRAVGRRTIQHREDFGKYGFPAVRVRDDALMHVAPVDPVRVERACDIANVVSLREAQPQVPIDRVEEALVVAAHCLVSRAADQRARVLDAVAKEQTPEGDLTRRQFAPRPGTALACDPALTVDLVAARMDESRTRRALHHLELEFERAGVDDVVIRVNGEQIAPGREGHPPSVNADVALVVLLTEETDARKIPIALQHSPAVVGGRVIDDDHLSPFGGDALQEHALNAFRKVSRVVMVRDDDGYERGRVPHLLKYRGPPLWQPIYYPCLALARHCRAVEVTVALDALAHKLRSEVRSARAQADGVGDRTGPRAAR